MAAQLTSTSDWIERFIDRLVELKPSINRDDATEMAVAELPTARSLMPEDAAAVYAERFRDN